MTSEKIRNYDELRDDEKELMHTIRNLKLMKDHATFSLYSFQLAELIEDYETLMNLREAIQMKYFAIFEDIQKNDLVDGEINVNLWAHNRDNENNVWKDELDKIQEIKNSLDVGIELIESGIAEEMIIQEEKNI